MRNILFATLFLVPFFVLSQDSIAVKKQKTDSFEIHKVLVIPFNQKMYISDSDRDLMEANNLSFQKMVSLFQKGMSLSVKNSIPGWWDSELLGEEDHEADAVYHQLSYKYELLDEKTSGAKREPFKKKEEKEQPKIVKGQIKIEQDNRPKFMNIKVKSDSLLPSLSARYGNDYFLFLNQLDLQSDLSDYAAVGNKTYNRIIKMHFTVLKKDGTQYFAGIASAPFPSQTKDMDVIIQKHFPEVAKALVAHLPPPVRIKKVKSKQ